MGTCRRPVRLLCASLAVSVAVATLASSALAGEASAPSLRLIGSERHVKLHSYGRRVPLSLGVYVSSAGGAFEVQASRQNYRSPVRVEQVDAATGDAIRDLPSRLLDGWNGLGGLIRVRFIGSHHKVAASESFTFCPNRPAEDLQRVTDGGPAQPTYPNVCSTSGFSPGEGFPFTKGMVWGLDRGWAAPALGSGSPPFVSNRVRVRPPAMRVPPGRYTVRVDITRPYRRLFDIPDTRASVQLAAKVSSRGRRFISPPIPTSRAPLRAEDVPTVTSPDPSTLPDLAALPAWYVLPWSRGGRDQLVFAATEWNAGPAPLVVEGFRESTVPEMAAYQYFYDADGNVVGRAPVGRLHYDRRRGHHHWHFEQFARYSLVGTSGGHPVRSHKQSFCIAPSNPVDLTLPGASWQPEVTSLSSACGQQDAIWVRESMPVGWGDTYLQYRAGQAIDITHVPNGSYLLKVQVNPGGQLYETNPANDVATRRIHIGGRRGHRSVRVHPWRGIPG